MVAALVYFAGAPALIKQMSSGMPGGSRLVAGEGDYQGAGSCAACPPTEFSQWSQSLHSRATTEEHFEPRYQQLSRGDDQRAMTKLPQSLANPYRRGIL